MSNWSRWGLTLPCLILLAPSAQAWHKTQRVTYVPGQSFALTGGTQSYTLVPQASSFGCLGASSFSVPASSYIVYNYGTGMSAQAAAEAQADLLGRSRDALRLLCRTLGEGGGGGGGGSNVERRLKDIEDRLSEIEKNLPKKKDGGGKPGPKKIITDEAAQAEAEAADPLVGASAAVDEALKARERAKAAYIRAKAVVDLESKMLAEVKKKLAGIGVDVDKNGDK